MALKNCEECGQEISDKAPSCTKCGAPVIRALSNNETKCPFCMTIVNINATVCPSCKALRGYTKSGNIVYGKARTIAFGIILPILLAIFCSVVGFVASGIWFIGTAILSMVALFSMYRLKTGPVWYRAISI